MYIYIYLFGTTVKFRIIGCSSLANSLANSKFTLVRYKMSSRYQRRLQRRREQERARHQLESAEQWEEWLRRRRIRDRARHAAQTVKQRQRLRYLSVHQHERLSTESSEQTATRLDQMSIRWCEQLEQQRSCQREREPSAQLDVQPSIQAKMRIFHQLSLSLTQSPLHNMEPCRHHVSTVYVIINLYSYMT